MSKVYILAICLLAASFTGCLSDDTSDLEEQQNTEDETIEPVGTDNNETEEYWYNELIAEVENLTDEFEKAFYNTTRNGNPTMIMTNLALKLTKAIHTH